MKYCSFSKVQQGATLIVSLIMLALITLLVTSAFTLSASSTQSVGNMQNREEAIAAANKAIEQVLSSPFTDDPAGESIDVDINNDDTRDYEVVFDTPTCVSAEQIAATTIPPSELSLGSFFSSAASYYYQTVWDLNATVFHQASGTSVRVRQGVRVLLSKLQYDAVCT
jgi:type II secretory pathway pseudopilin PulG